MIEKINDSSPDDSDGTNTNYTNSSVPEDIIEDFAVHLSGVKAPDWMVAMAVAAE